MPELHSIEFAKLDTSLPLDYGKSGVTKKAVKTLSVPAFYSGARFISETLAALPKAIYQKVGSVRKKVDHAVTPILAEFPNELVNALYLWETAISHAVMYGNGYVWIERRAGKVSSLYNLHACLVKPFRVNGQQYYAFKVAGDTKPLILPYKDIIHIRNFSEDGEQGISVIDELAETIGLPRKFDEYLNNYFENGAAVNLVIEAEGKLDRGDIDNIKYGIEQNHKGINNAHKAMVLSNAKAKTLTAPLKDFALDVLKQTSVDDIARVLRIPPHTLYSLQRATWSNLEQLGTELVKYSFTPWVTKIELELKSKLLTPQEVAKGYYVKWNLEGLQRGDYATRVEAGVKLVNNRLLTPNEWRAFEDLEPYDGGDGFFGPLNTAEVTSTEQPADSSSPTPADTTTTTESNPAEVTPLNGAQIQAAVEVVVQLRSGVLTQEAATALLVAVGISEADAKVMVASTVSAGPLPMTTAATPPGQEVTASKPNVAKQYGKFLEDAKQRVQTKQLKAFKNAEKKQGDEYDSWLIRFAQEQGTYLAESLNPFLSTVIEDAGELSIALQSACESYTELVQAERAEANPQRVIDKLIERVEQNGKNH